MDLMRRGYPDVELTLTSDEKIAIRTTWDAVQKEVEQVSSFKVVFNVIIHTCLFQFKRVLTRKLILFDLDPKLEVSAAKPRDDLVQIKQLYLLSRGLN